MKTDWIKVSEFGWPKDHQYPVDMADANTKQVHRWRNHYDMERCEPLWQGYTHWRPARDDVPKPPREKTQRDKDEDRYAEWYGDYFGEGYDCHLDTWHAALAYEREQVLKLLPESESKGIRAQECDRSHREIDHLRAALDGARESLDEILEIAEGAATTGCEGSIRRAKQALARIDELTKGNQ